MHIVLNNLEFYVVDYPSVRGNRGHRQTQGPRGLLAGDAASRFRRDLADAMNLNEDEDDFELCLDDYDGLLTQPAIYQ